MGVCMMRHVASLVLTGVLCPVIAINAAIIGVTGPNSSAGTAPAIIAAPTDILDDIVFNTGMEGFNEASGVVTTVAHSIDGGGTIPIGTLVNSHMIFLNSAGSASLSHTDVVWTFDGAILGVMSNGNGSFEAASTFELGNPLTNYTVTFAGSGPAAPFSNRGLESADSYVVALNQITVNMSVTEPGDWIRVVTAAPDSQIPEPGYAVPLLVALAGSAMWKRIRSQKRWRAPLRLGVGSREGR